MPDLSDFFVVGIGASAGGLDAIERFFASTPKNSGLAYVLVQHLSPDYKSMMSEILAQRTDMPIQLVTNGMTIEPNTVYLIPPRKNMELSNSRFSLSDQDAQAGLNLPIDVFFRSLAELKERAVAVVLSGTGSDGSRGLRDVRNAGGLVLAQDIASSGFDGMPRNAAATGLVDAVCPPSEMPKRILSYCNSPVNFRLNTQIAAESVEGMDDKSLIFRLFQTNYGIDFSLYRQTTINRRLERRIQLTRSPSLSAYVDRVKQDNNELDNLYRDLLVEVTRFFRDQEAFEMIRTQVVAPLLENCQPEQEIRVWVPGCATGEEAYSLAMLLDHEAQVRNLHPRIRVFATDVHPKSLNIASNAIYEVDAMTELPEDYRKSYFRVHGNHYHIIQHIRQSVIFAPHDITKDAPFTNLDLISCRNVLIYLEPEVQQRIVSMFHYGLKSGSFLFLGPSETVGKLDREFDSVDAHWRVYKKLRDVRLPEASRIPMPAAFVPKKNVPLIAAQTQGSRVNSLLSATYEQLLSRYVPPSLLLNERMELIHSFGDAVKFVEVPPGKPTMDILKMVGPELRMAISAAVHKADQENGRFCFSGVKVRTGDIEKTLRVAAEPFQRNGEKSYLVSLEEMKGPSNLVNDDQAFNASGESKDRIAELELDLNYTRESLQATVEELETSNEELQSSNEELVASNEELQSTNEELHSVNEELFTVNAEHQRKISELVELTDDMNNLLESTAIATLFLDNQLRIRRFTPAISAVFNLLEQDIGRPIEHISSNIHNAEFLFDLRKVLTTKTVMERNVTAQNGAYFLQRISPYCVANGEADGIVAVFTEISALRDFASTVAVLHSDMDALQGLTKSIATETKAPIDSLADMLKSLESATVTKPNDFQESIGGLQKLNRMLQGLVQFSQLVAKPQRFAQIDFPRLVDQALEAILPKYPEARTCIQLLSAPNSYGDPLQLALLLQSLICNAIENKGDAPLTIEISGERISEVPTVCVRDNGLGIPIEESGSIFRPFYKLKRHQSNDRLGMGLTIAKRIAERQGGNLWFESVPGEFTKFFFSLSRWNIGSSRSVI